MSHLEDENYYKKKPHSAQHKWHQVQCVIVVNDFGMEYMSKEHEQSLGGTMTS
jgi:hypothetical protein